MAEPFLDHRAATGGVLFDAGKRTAQVNQAQAAYDATAANYRQAVLTAFQQVEDNLGELRILEQESGIVDRAVNSPQRSVECRQRSTRQALPATCK